jgi:hypothetical protein
MIFESTYQTFLAACQDISRRRERLAKPAITRMLLPRLDPSVPNDALLSHIIAESLLRRIDRNLVESKNIYLEKFELSQIELFYAMCKGYPHVPQGHRVANQFLHHALRGWKSAALFEIGVGKAVQLAALLERLAEWPGRLQSLKVIALDPDPQNLTDSAARVAALRPTLGFDVTFHPIEALLEQCTPDRFRAIGELAGPNLVANTAYTFHHTVHAPDDGELRTQLLRRVNEYLRPQLFTLVEPSANHDTEHLPRRLHACWEHFGTVFDLIDQSDVDAAHKFVIKEKFFGREIRDIFGTSDAFRCERHESYDSWLLRLAKAGFVPYDRAVGVDVELPSYGTATTADSVVRLGYRDLPLIAVFAFASRGRRGGAAQ